MVVPDTDLIQINPPLTREEAITHQRNRTSIKLGEFLLNADGVHELELQIGAHEIYQGKYRLLAKYEDRNDSEYVELPYTLTVQNSALSLLSASIASVEETETGEALIHWISSADPSDISLVRVYLHDIAQGGQ